MGRYSHRADPDHLEEVHRYFAKRADTPFGDLELASGRTLQPFSSAVQRAASNPLIKARRALDNDERARAYVDRAARLPYDRYERSHPAADEAGRCTLRGVLMAIDHDYTLDRIERAWLQSATASIPHRTELRDLDLPPAELCDCALSVLAVRTAYRDARAAS